MVTVRTLIALRTFGFGFRAAVCDLACLESIRRFAEEYKGTKRPLHLLVNNAGVMASPKMYTADGFELQFGVNHVGHFELTRLLLPSLAASASPSRRSRIVVTTSAAELLGSFDFNDLNYQKSRFYFRWSAYGQSKLANSVFTVELARRCKAANLALSVNCFHPGIVDTELIRYVLPPSILERRRVTPTESSRFARMIGLKSAEEGASTGVYLALSPDVEGLSGGYYVEGQLKSPSANARNPELAQRLWEATENLVGHRFHVDE